MRAAPTPPAVPFDPFSRPARGPNGLLGSIVAVCGARGATTAADATNGNTESKKLFMANMELLSDVCLLLLNRVYTHGVGSRRILLFAG